MPATSGAGPIPPRGLKWMKRVTGERRVGDALRDLRRRIPPIWPWQTPTLLFGILPEQGQVPAPQKRRGVHSQDEAGTRSGGAWPARIRADDGRQS